MNKYEVILSSRYKTSLKKFSRHKHFDKDLLEKVVKFISTGEKLPSIYKDHQLIGIMKDYRECHVKNDLLLVYQKHEEVLILLLIDIGSHSSLFKK